MDPDSESTPIAAAAVSLGLPAGPDAAATLQAIAETVAVTEAFGHDDVDAIGLVVNEMTTELVGSADDEAVVHCEITSSASVVHVQLGAATHSVPRQDADDLDWQIVYALAPSATVRSRPDTTGDGFWTQMQFRWDRGRCSTRGTHALRELAGARGGFTSAA
ncbi:hypothetical protein IU510_08590 [Nocardia cyriacigeorgica]|uniref:hypothetical protein n=1 Tax=Nocardia cyriacigeorgica TaxID=135487 RepID=UPI00189418CF|nr:hypothetical protein [Nocardia cyriacigeorgica]MBF6098135.1 hypothetical protein [Nocardia cyriacigeorgica]MBF6317950.1 hypothetical protein [Nocardia cyriacigeorgica]MBF6532730.1 hypothetical protein [Nocardia cyriacigeorgica]